MNYPATLAPFHRHRELDQMILKVPLALIFFPVLRLEDGGQQGAASGHSPDGRGPGDRAGRPQEQHPEVGWRGCVLELEASVHELPCPIPQFTGCMALGTRTHT